MKLSTLIFLFTLSSIFAREISLPNPSFDEPNGNGWTAIGSPYWQAAGQVEFPSSADGIKTVTNYQIKTGDTVIVTATALNSGNRWQYSTRFEYYYIDRNGQEQSLALSRNFGSTSQPEKTRSFSITFPNSTPAEGHLLGIKILGGSVGNTSWSRIAEVKAELFDGGNGINNFNFEENIQWKLYWQDEFNSDGAPDSSKWSAAPRYSSDWNEYNTDSDELAYVQNGKLVVKGIVNPDQDSDPVPYQTGAIRTHGKFSFKYGKVDVRAKLGAAKGSWPAIWMMPEHSVYGGWPNSGEIDIMEHLNSDSNIYQTVHIENQSSKPAAATPAFNVGEFNNFGIEWYPDRIDYFVNGSKTYTYSRTEPVTSAQWPFDQEFYLILNQALGGSWVGSVNPDDLPAQMEVDYVRIYQPEGGNSEAAFNDTGWESDGGLVNWRSEDFMCDLPNSTSGLYQKTPYILNAGDTYFASMDSTSYGNRINLQTTTSLFVMDGEIPIELTSATATGWTRTLTWTVPENHPHLGKEVWFRLRSGGSDTWTRLLSAKLQKTTLPTAPIATISNITDVNFNVSWDQIPTATSYQILTSNDPNNFSMSTPIAVEADVTSQTINFSGEDLFIIVKAFKGSDSLSSFVTKAEMLKDLVINEVKASQNQTVFYRGKNQQQVLKLSINASNINSSSKLTSATFNLQGTTNTVDVLSATLYTSGTTPFFSPNSSSSQQAIAVSTAVSPIDGEISFDLEANLQEGTTNFWLTLELAETASGHNKIDAEVSAVEIGSIIPTITTPAPLGSGEVYPFDHRVVTYYRDDWLVRWNPDHLSSAHFNCITELVYFNIRPNADGSINFGNKDQLEEGITKFHNLRKDSPVEFVLGVVTGEMPTITADANLRAIFVENVIDYLVEHNFDGLDIDWEYPNNSTQWANFTKLITEFKTALYNHGLSLSIAVGSYRLPPIELCDQVDYINIMAYDFAGAHSTFAQMTGDINIYHNNLRQPKHKLVVGLPMYTNETRSNRDWNQQKGYSTVVAWNPDLQPQENYIISPETGEQHYFNGADLIQAKTQYLIQEGLGGSMFWGFDTEVDLTHEKSLMRAYSKIYKPERNFTLFPANNAYSQPINLTEMSIIFEKTILLQDQFLFTLHKGNQAIYTANINDVSLSGKKLTIPLPTNILRYNGQYSATITRESIKYTDGKFWEGVLHEDFWTFDTNYLKNSNFAVTTPKLNYNGQALTAVDGWTINGAVGGSNGQGYNTVYFGDDSYSLEQTTNYIIQSGDQITFTTTLRRDSASYMNKTAQLTLYAIDSELNRETIHTLALPANETPIREISVEIAPNSPFVGQKLGVQIGQAPGTNWINFLKTELNIISQEPPNIIGLALQQSGNLLTWQIPSEEGITEFRIIHEGETIIVPATGIYAYEYILENESEARLIIVRENGSHSQTYLPTEENRVRIEYNLQQGWNLIAAPGDNANLSELYQHIDKLCWGWNGKSYQLIDTPKVNEGFWVYATTTAKAIITADSTESDINLN